MAKLLIICPYPNGKAPSQRFRFEQYIKYLEENGVSVTQKPFWKDSEWPAIYQEGSALFKVWITFFAFLRRIAVLFSLPGYSRVFIHREATPIGPPWWEWSAAKLFGKALIYDFDDAIWLANSSKANERLVGRLKNHGKAAKIIKWSDRIVVGNDFLARFALKHNNEVSIVPTTLQIISEKGSLKANPGNQITIGWTGTHSTLRQLTPLFPLLKELHREIPFRFLLIADEAPGTMPNFVEFRKWQKKTETEDLLELDIGIMPLYSTDWEKGKCGFKALQYLALGIPAVVSEVGVNGEIVQDGHEGFLAEAMPIKSGQRWKVALKRLLGDEALRKKLGSAGREAVRKRYSTQVWRKTFVDLIQKT